MSTNPPFTHLGDMPIEKFLKEFWQKKPLFIKNALPEVPQIEPEELAGYALEEEIESRILIETSKGKEPLKSDWKLVHGPMTESSFSELPDTHWTLLVQAVDQLNPNINQLLNRFRFLPNWRLDDIMVSYATDQGSVGPHFDYYDVFLIQASGEREWSLGQTCNSQSPMRSDTDCKILRQFDKQTEFLAQPGDILYIPPQLAHWGIAKGNCMTYSVGFRAPSHSDILLDLTQELASQSNEDERYQDPDLSTRTNPGLIDQTDLARVKEALESLVSDQAALEHWFGRYMTQEKRETLCFDLQSSDAHNHLRIAPRARVAYIQGDSQDGSSSLFVNGEQFQASTHFCETLCSYSLIDPENFPDDSELINQLVDSDLLL